MYRKDFPLEPLPTACLVPTIIRAAQHGMPHENDLVVELYPTTEQCMVKKRRYFKKIATQGINKQTLALMQQTARDEQPKTFDRTAYLNHIHNAIKQAYGKVSHKHNRKLCECYS
jgi:hypothetical protein